MNRDTFDMFNPRDRGRFGENECGNDRVTGNDSVRSDLVDIPMALHHETERAILVSDNGEETRAVWIPKSRCEFEKHSSFIRGHRKNGQSTGFPSVTVSMRQGLAKEKGLI
jgi:hypothetical protein